MSNIRLYHPNNIVENSTGLLSKDHIHYLVNVMRLKRGSNINFFNKNGEWESEIIYLDKDRVEVKYLKKVKDSKEKIEIELAICLVKKSAMELIIQKATELGVNKIIPIISKRTEVKDLNIDRANKIAIEAIEQSNQLTPPEICQITKLDDFLSKIDPSKNLFFADINSKSKLSLSNKNYKKNIILVGPEGDFSLEERNQILSKKNTIPISLSENILRTDTAVISAISLVNFKVSDH